jgi:menaquinol-cytochrome c reductase cytochrome b/c subunit
MADIPESLLRRSAEAKAKALGVPVEQVLAEMKGEAPPTPPPRPARAAGVRRHAGRQGRARGVDEEPGRRDASEEVRADRSRAAERRPRVRDPACSEPEPRSPGRPPSRDDEPRSGSHRRGGTFRGSVCATEEPRPPATVAGTARRRRRSSPPDRWLPAANVPEGVRTQRLLTVVKARAIQNVKAEPQDKVNTWPHLMLAEFTALLAMTAFLLILSVILQAPLLEPANFNATPNPSKAPWYFLGLQELLSYFDPQIAGVTVPTIVGLVGFMMIPYVDKNPSNKPSDRKFAIMLYTIFLTGSATLTIIGVLFRGQGFNFAYPWRDGCSSTTSRTGCISNESRELDPDRVAVVAVLRRSPPSPSPGVGPAATGVAGCPPRPGRPTDPPWLDLPAGAGCRRA